MVVRASICPIPLVPPGPCYQSSRGVARVTAAGTALLYYILPNRAPLTQLRHPIRVTRLKYLPALAHGEAPSHVFHHQTTAPHLRSSYARRRTPLSRLCQFHCPMMTLFLTRLFVINPSVVVSSSVCKVVYQGVVYRGIPHGAPCRHILVHLAYIQERTMTSPVLRASSYPLLRLPLASPTGHQAAVSGPSKTSPTPLVRKRPTRPPQSQVSREDNQRARGAVTARRYAKRSTRTQVSAGSRGHGAGRRVPPSAHKTTSR